MVVTSTGHRQLLSASIEYSLGTLTLTLADSVSRGE